MKRVKTADAVPSEETVSIKGWVRTVRKQKTLAFVEVNDGSSLAGIQCVLSFDAIDEASMNGTYDILLLRLILLLLNYQAIVSCSSNSFIDSESHTSDFIRAYISVLRSK
jgi:aspartyl/asparaginyl-tRNA synthetase